MNFYHGEHRVVDQNAKEVFRYKDDEYLDFISEHVEQYSYLKFPYLKKIGWKGLVAGPDSGVYQATPLSRLNAADGMATPLAQAEYEKMFKTLGGKPVKKLLATHWARLIELLVRGRAPARAGATIHRSPQPTSAGYPRRFLRRESGSSRRRAAS